MTDEETKARVKKKEEHRSRVDDFFLVAFPCMFLVFNLIYWPTCLSKVESEGWPGAEGGDSAPQPPPMVTDPNLNQQHAAGLPLGIYTNHWHRTVNMAKAGLLGGADTCSGFDGGGRCPRSTEYLPDIDYDLQGIFDTPEEMPMHSAMLRYNWNWQSKVVGQKCDNLK